MANYTKATDFAAKDSMASGNPLKIITGTAHDNEYVAIAAAIASKADSVSPVLTSPNIGAAVGTSVTVTAGVQGATVTSTGNVNGVNGVFSGNVSGVAATFTGGVTANLTGNVTGNADTATSATSATTASILSGTAAVGIPSLTCTMASSAMTVGITSQYVDFRNVSLASGAVSTLLANPTALVVPATATLGTTNAVKGRQYILLMNNGGNSELAIIGSTPPSEDTLISTTAIAAASNSATTIYSAAARTNLPFRVMGYVESTQATAGTWATAASLIQGLIITQAISAIQSTTQAYTDISTNIATTAFAVSRDVGYNAVGSLFYGYAQTPLTSTFNSGTPIAPNGTYTCTASVPQKYLNAGNGASNITSGTFRCLGFAADDGSSLGKSNNTLWQRIA